MWTQRDVDDRATCQQVELTVTGLCQGDGYSPPHVVHTHLDPEAITRS